MPITLTVLLVGITAVVSALALILFLTRKRLARLFRSRGKWLEDDDYKRARRAYQGVGAGATRAALFLGMALLAVSAVAVAQQFSIWSIARLDDLNFVVIREHARSGEILSATVVNGKLVQDVTMERRFVADWVQWVREVSMDPLDMQDNWMQVQAHVTNIVHSKLAKYNETNPPAKMREMGRTRRVTINNVTPRGGNGGRVYRVDWTEIVYDHSSPIAQVRATADVELAYFTPRTDAEAWNNPVGIFVATFDWAPAPGS